MSGVVTMVAMSACSASRATAPGKQRPTCWAAGWGRWWDWSPGTLFSPQEAVEEGQRMERLIITTGRAARHCARSAAQRAALSL